ARPRPSRQNMLNLSPRALYTETHARAQKNLIVKARGAVERRQSSALKCPVAGCGNPPASGSGVRYRGSIEAAGHLIGALTAPCVGPRAGVTHRASPAVTRLLARRGFAALGKDSGPTRTLKGQQLTRDPPSSLTKPTADRWSDNYLDFARSVNPESADFGKN